MFRRFAAVGVSVAVVLGLGFASAPAASASPAHDNTDPIGTGCAAGSYIVASRSVVNSTYNEVQGRVDVLYSPTCQTNWLNLYGYVPGNRYHAFINNVGYGPVPTVGLAFLGAGSGYSLQTYSPGGSCIDVHWDVRDEATLQLEGVDWMRLC